MLTATRSCEIDEQQFVVAKSTARNRHERLLQTVQFVLKASCQNCSRFADVKRDIWRIIAFVKQNNNWRNEQNWNFWYFVRTFREINKWEISNDNYTKFVDHYLSRHFDKNIWRFQKQIENCLFDKRLLKENFENNK